MTCSMRREGETSKFGKSKMWELTHLSGEVFGLAERNKTAAAVVVSIEAAQGAVVPTFSIHHPGLGEVVSIALRLLVCVLKNDVG